ncbi:hypothetical protein [Gemmatimonas sp.]|uniref:hypothetical protein n=1 Tax=Gemmatimonas sp. TaxID=1962908 RepID=UPI0039839F35
MALVAQTALKSFFDQVLDALPPEDDPVPIQLPAQERVYVRAGPDFSWYRVFLAFRERETTRRMPRRFLDIVKTQTR